MIFWRYALFLPKDFPKRFPKRFHEGFSESSSERGARFVAKTDLLTGDVRALTLKIAAPSVAAMLAASVCPLLEALVLSARDASLSAAVGASLALILLEQTVGFTLGMGAGSFVSRCIGQGRREAARRAASTAFFAALGLSALLLAAGLLFAAPVLRLLGAPESAVAAGLPYARAVFVSGPPLCGALVLSSLLRAQGKTLPNMAAALVGSTLGAALLLLLCGRMGLGASGAGMAMLAREAATLAVLLAYTLRHGELIRPSLRRVRLTRAVFSQIMRSGLPTLLRQGATSVSAALLSRVSAGFGAPVLAGMGLCARAIMPFTSAVIGFGQGFQPVCGAAFGAKQTARCQEAYRFCQRVAIAFSLAAGLAFFALAPALAARFAPDAQSAEAARRALRLQGVAFPAQSAVILMTMLTQAMGLTLRASLVATSRQALFFLPLLAVLPRLFGLWGLLACQSASDLAALGFSLALTRGLRGSSSARCGCSDVRTACRSHPRSSS